MSDYKTGDSVEILVHNKNNGDKNWLPAIVNSIDDKGIILARRGSRLEKLAAVYMGWEGNYFFLSLEHQRDQIRPVPCALGEAEIRFYRGANPCRPQL